ncbi:MAG: hypothetical protein ACOC34_06060, partial [Thermotogota bacterium]
MDIQRLDIHEPCLVSYPHKDDEGNRIWFAHSYNVLQLSENTKVDEFDPGESKVNLPKDMYPVFKRHSEDRDAGNKFGLDSSKQFMTGNLWDISETQEYGDYEEFEDPSFEAIPVVGGNNSTTFRIKTHEDINRVEMELVDKQIWTAREYSSAIENENILATKNIIKDEASDEADGRGKGGYWEWELDLKDYFPNQETDAAIVVKAYKKIVDSDFFEQWQWPIFVDTKGPEIEMFRMEKIFEEDSQSWVNPDEIRMDHLKVDTRVATSVLSCCPSTVERWVGFEVTDLGGLMFEFEKGYLYSRGIGDPIDFTSDNVRDLRKDRRYDLCSNSNETEDCGSYSGHKVDLRAFDSVYTIFQKQNINNSDYLRLLGFPGNHPSPEDTRITPMASSSLKYLERPVREYEDLSVTNPWHPYYTNLTWGTYDGSNWKGDPREIPEIAFFNNIDLENGLWEDNDDITMKYLEFTLRDELGNIGIWESYLTRKDIVNLQEATVTVENGDCDDAELTVKATSTVDEKIEEITLIEKENKAIKSDSLLSGDPKPVTPNKFVEESFKAKDVLAPAYQGERKLQIIANTENDTEMVKEVTLDATFAGDEPMFELNPLSNYLDIKKYFEDIGKGILNGLIKESERYIYFGFVDDEATDPLTVQLISKDDNVDRYLLYHEIEANSTKHKTGLEEDAYGEMSHVLSHTPGETSGVITFFASSTDCPLESERASETLIINYQDPKDFIESVYATPASGNATGIIVELESDLLWVDETELMGYFDFEVNGSPRPPKAVWMDDGSGN